MQEESSVADPADVDVKDGPHCVSDGRAVSHLPSVAGDVYDQSITMRFDDVERRSPHHRRR